MTSTYQDLLQHKRLGKSHSYDEQRVILYGFWMISGEKQCHLQEIGVKRQ